MISILCLLLLLSLILFIYKNNKEGLDNCPPLEGPTTTGMHNEATLSSIKTNVVYIHIIALLLNKMQL